MRVQFLAIVLMLMFESIPLTGCLRRHDTMPEAIDRSYSPQIRSLSYRNSRQAVVTEKSRDLNTSIDGGLSWQSIPGQVVGGQFECATFLNLNQGWAVNHEGQVFTTNDGGSSWTKISDLANFTGAKEIEFLNEADGWILEFLSIWSTHDGGVTWHEILNTLTPGVKGQPTRIYPLDVSHLVASGTEAQVYLTRDGGATWKIETLATNADLRDVWFTDNQRGWLSGYVGGDEFRPLLFETKNGGASWKEIMLADKKITPSSICFFGDEGWLAGNRWVEDGGLSGRLEAVLFHTDDGGIHWTLVRVASSDPSFNLVRFTDREHGWLAGRDNLYHTEDSGKTWKRVLGLPSL